MENRIRISQNLQQTLSNLDFTGAANIVPNLDEGIRLMIEQHTNSMFPNQAISEEIQTVIDQFRTLSEMTSKDIFAWKLVTESSTKQDLLDNIDRYPSMKEIKENIHEVMSVIQLETGYLEFNDPADALMWKLTYGAV